jgi:hypothetical protein
LVGKDNTALDCVSLMLLIREDAVSPTVSTYPARQSLCYPICAEGRADQISCHKDPLYCVSSQIPYGTSCSKSTVSSISWYSVLQKVAHHVSANGDQLRERPAITALQPGHCLQWFGLCQREHRHGLCENGADRRGCCGTHSKE